MSATKKTKTVEEALLHMWLNTTANNQRKLFALVSEINPEYAATMLQLYRERLIKRKDAVMEVMTKLSAYEIRREKEHHQAVLVSPDYDPMEKTASDITLQFIRTGDAI